MFDGFTSELVQGDGAEVFVRRRGSGPALLLLHGFPQTHLMWRDVAARLSDSFSIVCADLRGYGRSSCPASAPDHMPYSKRAMAADMAAVMRRLGFTSFGVAGHDRGGRVAYRLALDRPDVVRRLALMDIVTGLDAWERADARFALSFWPWSLLAQAEPLPEQLILGNPSAVVDDASTQWGSPRSAFTPQARHEYVAALSDPARVHAICEEYRAAAGVDVMHDRADRSAGRKISCPTLLLWSRTGAVGQWYSGEGGPLALWRAWAPDVRGEALEAGHFFPEEQPELVADRLANFFSSE